ncbi:MAG: Gfo/Idh/MocA family protein, partial [Acidimicrobiales bacterium]
MTIRFGVLGAARISGKALYQPAIDTEGVGLEAIAARDRSRAEVDATQWGIARVLDSYDEVLADPDIDAIYNPLPVSLHHTWTIAALEAGKHVLSEKPFAANAALARQIVDAADRTGQVCMEAFHWRYHPMAARIREILDAGSLGAIQSVDAVFDVYIQPEDDVRQSFELCGGALMDLGCYP